MDEDEVAGEQGDDVQDMEENEGAGEDEVEGEVDPSYNTHEARRAELPQCFTPTLPVPGCLGWFYFKLLMLVPTTAGVQEESGPYKTHGGFLQSLHRIMPQAWKAGDYFFFPPWFVKLVRTKGEVTPETTRFEDFKKDLLAAVGATRPRKVKRLARTPAVGGRRTKRPRRDDVAADRAAVTAAQLGTLSLGGAAACGGAAVRVGSSRELAALLGGPATGGRGRAAPTSRSRHSHSAVGGGRRGVEPTDGENAVDGKAGPPTPPDDPTFPRAFALVRHADVGTPAARATLQFGDQIRRICRTEFHSEAVTTMAGLRDALADWPAVVVTVDISRGGVPLTLWMTWPTAGMPLGVLLQDMAVPNLLQGVADFRAGRNDALLPAGLVPLVHAQGGGGFDPPGGMWPGSHRDGSGWDGTGMEVENGFALGVDFTDSDTGMETDLPGEATRTGGSSAACCWGSLPAVADHVIDSKRDETTPPIVWIEAWGEATARPIGDDSGYSYGTTTTTTTLDEVMAGPGDGGDFLCSALVTQRCASDHASANEFPRTPMPRALHAAPAGGMAATPTQPEWSLEEDLIEGARPLMLTHVGGHSFVAGQGLDAAAADSRPLMIARQAADRAVQMAAAAAAAAKKPGADDSLTGEVSSSAWLPADLEPTPLSAMT